ncbi:MAG: (2Fe-2S) ferredoxin domain-containing protein [Bacteroidales bacterium]|nr:(2Fe-2S) ferredoxin domain-containing protein [Bacteroidales bacterium]MBN2756540.1 (2Fe-2S) ferredoxin domain-containing protein [Bacteroidales bacterium]
MINKKKEKIIDTEKLQNENKKIHICNGKSCSIAGTQEILKDWLKEDFKDEEIGYYPCFGKCDTNFALFYDGKAYSAPSAKSLKKIINK